MIQKGHGVEKSEKSSIIIFMSKKRSRFRKLVWYSLFSLVFGAVILGAVFTYSLVRNLPNPERITERSVIESTKIYDRGGKVLLYEIHGEEKRTVLALSDIPEKVRLAAIAAEDLNFYKHHGLDWKGILRALIKNVLRGDITQGGSTITQQLIKNSILTSERTFTRKIREALLAILLENKYSKDEILEFYLNQIPYGSNAYGISAAADTYFTKPVGELSLNEIASLAALPKAPTYYSPYGTHKDALLERKNWILDRMAEEGWVSKNEADGAKKSSLKFSPHKQAIRAPHFVMYVREYLSQKYGEEFVERSGLRVITTLDWKLQEEAEKFVREGAEQNEKLVQAKNAALTAINPKTGEILAMVGSRDYFDLSNDGNVNVTTRQRQPGSAFKPFVYAAAFKKGYTPETVLMDVPMEFNPLCNPDGTPGLAVLDPKNCYHPKNYDDKFRGPVTLRQALAQSLNVPSVELLYLTGVEDSIKTAEDLGITTLTDPKRYGLSLVLGGAEVTLLEMVSAFGVFAADGILHPKTAILRVERGELTLEEHKTISAPVMDSEVARTLNDILSDNESRVPVFNPRSSLYFENRQVAAKTGTTQDYRDAWVVGYSPSLVAGVWVGNNDNTPMNQKGLSIMVAGPIWHRFMEFALASSPPEEFAPAEKNIPSKPVFRGLYREGAVVRIDKISRKLATENTPPELIEEVGLGKPVPILYFVKKADPTGPPPENPFEDGQYKNWLAGIEQWLSQNQIPIPIPPQGYDDLHLPEKKPKLSFLFPADNNNSVGVLSGIIIKQESTFPLQELSFFINDGLEGSRTAPIIPGIMEFKLENNLPPGTYKIKITAHDAVGNRETVEREITVLKSE